MRMLYRRLLDAARVPALLLIAAMLMTGLHPALALAQETKKSKPQEIAKPVIVFNLASLNRVFDHAKFLFTDIERPELMDFLNAQLANVRDLKGVDRNRPGGLMIFLAEGLIPTPIPVAFVPISDINEFQQTLATTPLKLKRASEGEDRYEITQPSGQIQAVRLMHDYAFIAQSQEQLDREFVNPAEFNQSLSNRYDLAVSANLKTIPQPVKELLVNLIRTSTQASMQQRDDEPEAGYRIRKAQAEGNLHTIEGILLEGDEATIGARLDQKNRKASLEFILRAKPDTGFAKELAGQARPSYFAGAIDHLVPLSISMSGEINDYSKKALAEYFKVFESEANRGLAKLPVGTKAEEIPQLEPIRGLFESLKATVGGGHFDGFMQFFGDPTENFTIVGGVRLMEGTKFGVGLTDILNRLREDKSQFAVEMSAVSHQDVVFHRIKPNSIGNDNQKIYGDDAAIYVGTDNNAVWVAFGGKDALPKLRAAMDKVEESKAHAPKTEGLAPFELVFNLNQWIKLQESKGLRRGPLAELTPKAFQQAGSDTLRVDMRPIENGFRMRFQVENGFLKLLGLGIARQIDGKEAP